MRTSTVNILTALFSLLLICLLQYLRKCDNIYLLKDGRVLETGTHEELMKSGSSYANIVTMHYRRPTPPGKHILVVIVYF